MSDIIIEGKNLNDLNQSNFQTVGPKGGFYFTRNGSYDDYKPRQWLESEPSTDDFYHDNVENHAFNRGLSPNEFSPFYEALRYTAVEPWQGRLEHTRKILNRANEGTSSIFLIERTFEGPTPHHNNAEFGNYLYYNLFYLNNLVEFKNYNPSSETRWEDNDGTWNFGLNLHNVNEKFLKIQNSSRLGVEPRFDTSNNPKYFFITDNRFSLGTYTENNKQYWELQTSNPLTRESQFSLTKMKTAFASKVNNNIIRSEEEEFSVDAFVFTEREEKTTPLCFYYDKKLHHERYNLASTGKVMMKIELRESGRDTSNNVDLFKAREPIRPFLLGFIADEQDGAIGNQIFGEGLYLFNQVVTLTAVANEENYLLGIYDLDDVLLSQGTGAEVEYTLTMPKEDVQYEARFRPNPLVRFNTRDEGVVRVDGDEDAKAEIRLWRSSIIYDNDETEYYTDAPQGESRGDFAPIGTTVEDFTLRPSTSDTDIYTVEYRALTDNYKFKGWSYLSGSESTPTELPRLANINADENYGYWTSTPLGSDETNIRTFKLTQDFRYPDGLFQIYADFALIKFAIENLNNYVDFENNFAEALKYGPFKFATALGGQLGGAPSVDDYRFDNITSFPAYSPNEPNVRLYIAGPGMGYVNTPTIPPIEEVPTGAPNGWSPANPMIGTLSPLEQWIWNGGGWEENPNYDPSNNQSVDYLPSGEYGHLTPIEETGFDFGAFFWHKNIANETKIEGEPGTIPNTLQTAINIAGEYPPTYNSSGNNQQLSGTANSPSPNYDVGDTAGPGGIFKVTEVTLDQAGSENGNYFWDVDWGPNLSDSQLSNESTLYDLSDNEFEFKGIELRGDLGEDDFLSSFEINQIISTETTSSISYQPLQRGVYVKVIDDGFISTFIERSVINSMTPIRPKELSGAIDADMEGFGRSVVYNLTPSQASMPPEILAYVAQENGDLTLSTNIFPGLTKEALGVEWNPDDWSPNGGGTFKYTAPESREATYMAGDDEISLFWKYIEFRIVVQETAEGEQSESGEAVDPSFYVGLNIFSMPGSGGQIFNDETDEIVSTGGLINLFNIEETVDENGIMYQEFSQIPSGQRNIILRAVPSAGQFADGDEGTWSFMADPGVNVDTVGSIQEFLNPDGHHIAIITFNEEGPVTVSYSWLGDEDGGGF